MTVSLPAWLRKVPWGRLALLFLGLLLPLLVVGEIAEDLLEGRRFAFEAPWLLALHAHATPALDRVAVTLSLVGGVTVIAPVSAALLAGLWWRCRSRAPYFAAAVAGAAGLDLILKLVFHRPRPELWPRLVPESDASFPSGHAMYSAAFVTAVILLVWPTRLRWPALVLGTLFSLAVGLSRLYLGVHFPTDVLAGWLGGLAWAVGTSLLLLRRR